LWVVNCRWFLDFERLLSPQETLSKKQVGANLRPENIDQF